MHEKNCSISYILHECVFNAIKWSIFFFAGSCHPENSLTFFSMVLVWSSCKLLWFSNDYHETQFHTSKCQVSNILYILNYGQMIHKGNNPGLLPFAVNFWPSNHFLIIVPNGVFRLAIFWLYWV